MMKRSLQITMLVLATIPLVRGILNFLAGAGGVVPADQITVDLDSQLRANGIWFTVVFFLTIWCIRNLEIAGPVMRIMFIIMALSGVARLYSLVTFGAFDPESVVAVTIEIGVLAFIPWHATYMRTLNKRDKPQLSPVQPV